MKVRNGFTLIELLIAVTASVVIVGLALGIYRHTAKSESLLRVNHGKYFLRSRLLSLVQGMLLRQNGPVYGNGERLVFVSDMNVLGYGQELVAFSGGSDYRGVDCLQITIVPMRFAGSGTIDQRAATLFERPDTPYEYSHKESVKGFFPRFVYEDRDDTLVREAIGARDVTLAISLTEGESHEWFIAGPRRG